MECCDCTDETDDPQTCPHCGRGPYCDDCMNECADRCTELSGLKSQVDDLKRELAAAVHQALASRPGVEMFGVGVEWEDGSKGWATDRTFLHLIIDGNERSSRVEIPIFTYTAEEIESFLEQVRQQEGVLSADIRPVTIPGWEGE